MADYPQLVMKCRQGETITNGSVNRANALIFPELGDRDVVKLTPQIIRAWHERLERRHRHACALSRTKPQRTPAKLR